MKKGGFGMKASGFTIVETMIVMAVTGVMFISAVVLISGRAAKTQFSTGANDLKEQLEQVINETASGYFPSNGNFKCAKGVPPNYLPQLTQANNQQGTNGECIFLGKAVMFGASDASDRYLIYSITGNRLVPGTTQEVTSLPQSVPEAVAPGITNNTGLTGITLSTPLENGLSAGTMKYTGTSSSGSTAGFALLSTFAAYSTADGTDCSGVCSGAQTLKLYAVTPSNIGSVSSAQFADKLDGVAGYQPVQTVTICLNSGTTNQSAVYTIGATGGTQSVDLKFQNGACT